MVRVPRRRALTSLSAADWGEIIVSTIIACLVEVGIRLLPLPRLSRALGVPLSTRPTEATPTPARASAGTVHQVRLVRRVMRHWPWGDTCLRHALVLGNRLRRLDPVLRVGVGRFDDAVRAHAWLEIEGRVLDPIGGARSYHLLESVPSVRS